MVASVEGLAFASALVRLSQLVQRVFTEVSREHELTPQQTQLLCVLTGGPVGMTELSRALNLEKSSLTGLTDRVVRRGLVAREQDAQDRRACRISLTANGKQLADETHDDICARLTELSGTLADPDRAHLATLIGHILANQLPDTAQPSHLPAF